MSEYKRNAIVCVSGGVDSITTAYYVAKVVRPFKMMLLHCNYGQRTAEYESWCVKKASDDLNVPLKQIDVTWLKELSTSLLVKDEPIPETKEEDLWNPEQAKKRILRWWDVCRNAILLIIGLAHAESFDLSNYLSTGKRELWDVYIGIRRETPVTMKDNTPEFVEEMNKVAEVSTHFGGYKVYAPLICLDKDAVVRLGLSLGVKWIYTYSCYQGSGWIKEFPVHCGTCSNCKRRYLAFRDAGIPDPSLYLKPPINGDFIKETSGVYVSKAWRTLKDKVALTNFGSA